MGNRPNIAHFRTRDAHFRRVGVPSVVAHAFALALRQDLRVHLLKNSGHSVSRLRRRVAPSDHGVHFSGVGVALFSGVQQNRGCAVKRRAYLGHHNVVSVASGMDIFLCYFKVDSPAKRG